MFNYLKNLTHWCTVGGDGSSIAFSLPLCCIDVSCYDMILYIYNMILRLLCVGITHVKRLRSWLWPWALPGYTTVRSMLIVSIFGEVVLFPKFDLVYSGSVVLDEFLLD